MGLYLDSADPDHAREAQSLGFIDGLTMTPKLIAETGRAPLDILAELVELIEGNIFYPLTGASLEARADEAWEAYSIRPDRVVLEIPTTMENLKLLAELSKEIECATTAIFSPAQAYMAAEAGAHFVIPYVHHTSQVLGDGPGLVQAMADVLQGFDVEILAADITSPDEAIQALRAGADHLTMPMSMIWAMGEHEYSHQVIAEFSAALRGE